MHKIDTNTAVDGYFVDKNASLGVEGTVVDADWLNSVQDEICNVVEAAGETPNKQNNGQMTAAIGILTKNACSRTVISSSSVKQTVSQSSLRISDYFTLAPGYFIDENLFVRITTASSSAGSIHFNLRKSGVNSPIYEFFDVVSTAVGIQGGRILQRVGDAVVPGDDYYFSIDITSTAPDAYEFDIEGIVSKN